MNDEFLATSHTGLIWVLFDAVVKTVSLPATRCWQNRRRVVLRGHSNIIILNNHRRYHYRFVFHLSLTHTLMSSLAATQADGYYLPPEFYESGAKSKNQWYARRQGSSSSSKKKKTGATTTVRFELADPCVCIRCEARIGKGTRFNAIKSAEPVDSYLSTPIWEFTTTCRRCGQGHFVIRTDPRHRGFVYTGDLRRQDRTWDATAVGGITVRDEKQDDEHDDDSPVDRLERQAFGLRNAVTEQRQLQQLVRLNEQTYGEDVTGNARLRDSFRRDRRVRRRLRAAAAHRGWKESLTFVETNVEDESDARSVVFGNGRRDETARWKRVRESSVFATSSRAKIAATSASGATTPRPANAVSSSDAPTSNPMDGFEKDQTPLTTTTTTMTAATAAADMPRPKRRVVVVAATTKGVAVTAADRDITERESSSSSKPSTLQSLVAGYGSSDDEEE